MILVFSQLAAGVHIPTGSVVNSTACVADIIGITDTFRDQGACWWDYVDWRGCWRLWTWIIKMRLAFQIRRTLQNIDSIL